MGYLETALDKLAELAMPAESGRMPELFEVTAKYELACWEMASTGEDRPGLGEG